MIKLTNIFGAIFFSCISFAQVRVTDVEFAEYVYDFGEINEVDGDVSHIFKFNNIGDAPFIITSISTSCGCTTPTYNREPIKPGQGSSIKVVFDPANQPGRVEKRIIVNGNIPNGAVNLIIKAIIKPRPRTIEDDFPVSFGAGIRLADVVINGYNVANSKESTFSMDIINTSTKAANISVLSDSLPKWINALVVHPIVNGGQRTKLLVMVRPNGLLWGKKSVSIPILVNNKVQFLNIIFNATFVEDFSILTKSDLKNAPKAIFSNRFYHFSTVNVDEHLEYNFKIKNAGINDLIIRYIDQPCKVKVDIANRTLKAGQEAQVTLIMDSSTAEAVAETIRFITNDPITPVVEFRVMANIK